MTTSARSHRAARKASRQHGNIAFDQLRTLGWSEELIKTRARAGWLIPRHLGVYALGHVPRTRESRFMAAVLALGPEAALSHRTAAALHGLLRGAVPTEVTGPTTGRRDRDAIIVHRNALRANETVIVQGIPVTTVLRTVLDCAAVMQGHALRSVFEEAQIRHQLDPDLVAVECLSRRGYRGNARVTRLLEDAVDPARVRSRLELRFLKLCARYGIKKPLVNEVIGPWRPDFYWPAERFVVETDGYDFHRTAWARERDRRRDDYMRSIGLRVLRLTWGDVADRAPQTAARISAALQTAA